MRLKFIKLHVTDSNTVYNTRIRHLQLLLKKDNLSWMFPLFPCCSSPFAKTEEKTTFTLKISQFHHVQTEEFVEYHTDGWTIVRVFSHYMNSKYNWQWRRTVTLFEGLFFYPGPNSWNTIINKENSNAGLFTSPNTNTVTQQLQPTSCWGANVRIFFKGAHQCFLDLKVSCEWQEVDGDILQRWCENNQIRLDDVHVKLKFSLAQLWKNTGTVLQNKSNTV